MGDLPQGHVLDSQGSPIQVRSCMERDQGTADSAVECAGEDASRMSFLRVRIRRRTRLMHLAWSMIRTTSSTDMLFHRARRVVFLVLLPVGLTAAGLVWHHKSGPKHMLAVKPGILYRSGFLRPHNLRKVLEKYGIKTVVNLCKVNPFGTGEREDQEIRICKEQGVRFVRIPMEPEIPPTNEQVAHWLALIEDEENLPILVHCKHGVIRTGMMVAVYEMEVLKRKNRRVLAEIPTFGHDIQKPKRIIRAA